MLLRDIEELTLGCAEVGPSNCLGQCSQSPRIKIIKEGEEPEKVGLIRSFQATRDLVERCTGKVNELQATIGECKYLARRDLRPRVRKDLLEKAQRLLETDQGANGTTALAQVLALRALERARTESLASAVTDANKVIELIPDWSRAHLILSIAQERIGNTAAAKDSIQKALELGKKGDFDSEAAKCRLDRLKTGDKDESVMEKRCSEEPTEDAWKLLLAEMSSEAKAAAETEVAAASQEPKAPAAAGKSDSGSKGICRENSLMKASPLGKAPPDQGWFQALCACMSSPGPDPHDVDGTEK